MGLAWLPAAICQLPLSSRAHCPALRTQDDLPTNPLSCRRYRNFELLHRRLREGAAGYRATGLAPPPKRLLSHVHDIKFVNKRRLELDAFLQGLLQVGAPAVRACLQRGGGGSTSAACVDARPSTRLLGRRCSLPTVR
jgi:hypothetical protein